MLLTGRGDPGSVARGLRTVLPRARIVVYGGDIAGAERIAAEAAGAEVRAVPRLSGDALLRRMLAEIDADVYILADGARPEAVCAAPLLVAEVDAGKDLVSVGHIADEALPDLGDRLLDRAARFLYGRDGDALRADVTACSRRLAVSYRRTAPRRGEGGASARALTLHALALRLPLGRVAALGARPDRRAMPRGVGGWAALLVLIGRLLVEERPRRILGLIGLALVAAGIAAATTALDVRHARAAMPPGPRALAALLLVASGTAVGAAGLLLDAMASARQEVGRLGAAAIPRRAERRGPDQSSVS